MSNLWAVVRCRGLGSLFRGIPEAAGKSFQVLHAVAVCGIFHASAYWFGQCLASDNKSDLRTKLLLKRLVAGEELFLVDEMTATEPKQTRSMATNGG